MQVLVRFLMVFGILLVVTTSTVIASRRGEAQTEWIAYLANLNGSTDLYVMSPDGQNSRRLTENIGRATQPIWSPNGAWLLVSSLTSSQRLLYKVHVTGSGNHAVADQTGASGYTAAVAWSPDGDAFAYIALENGVHGVYVVSAAGGGRTRIASSRNTVPSGLTWSPDGEWITYNVANIIIRVRPDGTDNTQLTSGGLRLTDALPSWSPDGQFLVYHSRTRDGSYTSLYRIRNERPILDQITGDNVAYEMPNWSPDGELIAALGTELQTSSADPAVLTGQGGRDLYVMQPDGSQVVQLTDGFFLDEPPQWSPDGDWLIFASSHIGLSTIYRIRPDGSDLQQLTDHLASYRSPTWSSRIHKTLSEVNLLGLSALLLILPPAFWRFLQALMKRIDRRVIMEARPNQFKTMPQKRK